MKMNIRKTAQGIFAELLYSAALLTAGLLIAVGFIR